MSTQWGASIKPVVLTADEARAQGYLVFGAVAIKGPHYAPTAVIKVTQTEKGTEKC